MYVPPFAFLGPKKFVPCAWDRACLRTQPPPLVFFVVAVERDAITSSHCHGTGLHLLIPTKKICIHSFIFFPFSVWRLIFDDLGDFGAASPVGSRLSELVLTHAAPELFQGPYSSKESDIFAYGIALWELCNLNECYQWSIDAKKTTK
jgi:hypothetical protein